MIYSEIGKIRMKGGVQVVTTRKGGGSGKDSKKTPTSINIDEDLWRQVRKAAIDKGITARDFFEAALREKLQRDKVRVSNVD
jgi:hypothetical protein